MSGRRAEAALLGALLSEGVRWAEETGETGLPCPFPEEEALMARAAPGRRREFATARRCAHRALAALGVAAAPLLRGRRGAPAWPPDTVGSITHCAGYRGAAVAPAARFLALGIDAEPHAPLPAGVREAVAFGPEEARLRALTARRPDIAWDRLLFSAKESVYKAWSGYGGAWLGFEDAEVSWPYGSEEAPSPGRPGAVDRPCPSPRARTGRTEALGRFRARLLVDPPLPSAAAPSLFPRVLPGRWLVREGLLLTAVAVPRPVPPPHRTAPKEHLR
ncbi:4'-phosphopantetheinyl transferase family protein [Streptomyces tanashiensis]|uniref:4'-phosphopantetheinyl transferase family protein n=1 Tax=Streptomyces tanashiensis TaxID=67367 RepID=UPI0033CA59FF